LATEEFPLIDDLASVGRFAYKMMLQNLENKLSAYWRWNAIYNEVNDQLRKGKYRWESFCTYEINY